jgi:hypothetical protein
MLLNLFNCQDDVSFAGAMESVKQSLLIGEYPVNGHNLKLPFAKQFEGLFGEKFSSNEGHYNHFCNVVGSMAHILTYAEKNTKSLLPKGVSDIDTTFDMRRRLDNMMIAYYHDIGKTIIPRRHAIEGKALFAEPKASLRHRFEEILAHYPAGESLPLTLAYYAESIGAHDLFGTVSTGENGLLSLAGVISRFINLFNDDRYKVKTAVFDLWLLNVADIITSLKNKGDVQSWQQKCIGSLDSELDLFFQGYKGKYLLADLDAALQIADADDTYKTAREIADKHAAHRLARLARQTLGDVVEKDDSFPGGLRKAVISRLEDSCLIAGINDILRGEFGDDYAQCFGNMLQFDYALGFFSTLSAQAVKWIQEELTPDSTFRTGWLHKPKIPADNQYPPHFIDKYNAECIVNNYMMVLAGIFGEIHRLTADIDSWNIEFEDAKNRLTPSKADKLLFLDGAYRAGNARVLLMREIMLYKA